MTPIGLYVDIDVDAPDFVAVVDLGPDSDTYQEIVDRVGMPTRGDELHHFGWNACSSSCHMEGLERRHLVIPGNRSGRIHIIDTKNRRNPELVNVIEPEEVHEHDLSGPHTTHCIPDGKILISMLGNADGDLPGGFLELDDDFEIEGRWELPGEIDFNYDFWYQPRHNVMLIGVGRARDLPAGVRYGGRRRRQVRPPAALLGLGGQNGRPDDRSR